MLFIFTGFAKEGNEQFVCTKTGFIASFPKMSQQKCSIKGGNNFEAYFNFMVTK